MPRTNFAKSIKRNKRNMRKSKNHTRKQKGGKSPSCMVKPDVSKYVKNSCHTANLHNTSPEVDYSLITDTGMSGGSVKPVTFSSYVNKVADKLGVEGATSLSRGDLEQQLAGADGHPSGKQEGAGYSTNPEQQIAGMPVYDKYDDCCQPALVRGKLVEGGKAGAICGNQMGGKTKKVPSKRKYKSKKVSKGKKRGKMNGGSRSAKYPSESHSGLNSDFDPSGKGKKFEGKQPFWGARTR